MEVEVQRLNGGVEALRAEIKRLRCLLEDLNRRDERSTSRIQKLERQLANSEANNGMHYEKWVAQAQKVTKLQRQLAQCEEDLAEWERLRDESKEVYNYMRNDRNKFRSENETLRAEIEQLRRQPEPPVVEVPDVPFDNDEYRAQTPQRPDASLPSPPPTGRKRRREQHESPEPKRVRREPEPELEPEPEFEPEPEPEPELEPEPDLPLERPLKANPNASIRDAMSRFVDAFLDDPLLFPCLTNADPTERMAYICTSFLAGRFRLYYRGYLEQIEELDPLHAEQRANFDCAHNREGDISYWFVTLMRERDEVKHAIYPKCRKVCKTHSFGRTNPDPQKNKFCVYGIQFS